MGARGPSVTPLGQDGPYASLPGNELAIFALAGPMSSTGIDGREPMRMAGRTISYQAGTVAALAVLAAIRRAEATGKGAIIDAAGVAAQLGSIAGLSTPEAVDRCRAHGLAAAPVLGEGACLADEHLVARRALRANGSEDLGEFLFPDHRFSWDGPPLRQDPLCRMGADNATVYRRWLGCTDEALAALDQAGQLSEDYLQPDGTAF